VQYMRKYTDNQNTFLKQKMENKLHIFIEKIKTLEKDKIKKVNNVFASYYILIMKKVTPYMIDSSICVLYCIVSLGKILIPMYDRLINPGGSKMKISSALEKTRQKNDMLQQVVENDYGLVLSECQMEPVWLMTSHIYEKFMDQSKKRKVPIQELYEDYMGRLVHLEQAQIRMKAILDSLDDEDVKHVFEPFEPEINYLKANFKCACLEIYKNIAMYENEMGKQNCESLRNKFESFVW